MPHLLPKLLMPRAAASAGISRVRNAISGEDSNELKQINELVLAHQTLPLNERGEVDTRSEAGMACCTKFLEVLVATAARLGAEASDRSYRKEFSRNYRILFPDSKRRYRVDVLEASLEQLDCFWVNGVQFKLCEQVMNAGDALTAAWRDLGDLLRRWASGRRGRSAEVRELLGRVDAAWSRFECPYIRELIKIEEQARGIVLDVIELDKKVCLVEESSGKDASDDAQAARVIAEGLVGAFEALRRYFRQAAQHLERVDPYLANNAGLVQRLVDYEESWEVANRYLSQPPMLAGLHAAVRRLGALLRREPAFEAMVQDCDAELFMVLPRLMWLFFLQTPSEHASLMGSILPDCLSFGQGALEPDATLEAFVRQFRHLTEALSDRFAADVPEVDWLLAAHRGRGFAASASEIPMDVKADICGEIEVEICEL